MAVQESKQRVALITGVTGQDGAYLAELLLGKGYVVHGIKRRVVLLQHRAHRSSLSDPHDDGVQFLLHYGDMTDATNLIRIVQETQPDEIYNLAAQSHVQVSASRRRNTPPTPTRSARCGCWKPSASSAWTKVTRFYQASTSELYGKVQETPQRETTPFYPRSPYAAAKLYALLDHGELPRGLRHARLQRHPVQSRKSDPRRDLRDAQDHARAWPPSSSACKTTLYLGNLDAKRDWGHARDYVEGMWRIAAAGRARRLRAGDRRDAFGARIRRTGVRRRRPQHRLARRRRRREGRRRQDRQDVVRIDPRYFRPTEVDALDRRPAQGATASSAGSRRRRSRRWSRRWWRAIWRARGGRLPMAKTAVRAEGQDGLRRRPSRHGRLRHGAAAGAARTSRF